MVVRRATSTEIIISRGLRSAMFVNEIFLCARLREDGALKGIDLKLMADV